MEVASKFWQVFLSSPLVPSLECDRATQMQIADAHPSKELWNVAGEITHVEEVRVTRL